MYHWPTEIQIGVETFKIKCVSLDELNNIQGLNGADKIEELDGYLSYIDNTIYVCDDKSETSRLQIILHEILHAIGNEYSIKQTETEIDVFANELTKFILALQYADNTFDPMKTIKGMADKVGHGAIDLKNVGIKCVGGALTQTGETFIRRDCVTMGDGIN